METTSQALSDWTREGPTQSALHPVFPLKHKFRIWTKRNEASPIYTSVSSLNSMLCVLVTLWSCSSSWWVWRSIHHAGSQGGSHSAAGRCLQVSNAAQCWCFPAPSGCDTSPFALWKPPSAVPPRCSLLGCCVPQALDVSLLQEKTFLTHWARRNSVMSPQNYSGTRPDVIRHSFIGFCFFLQSCQVHNVLKKFDTALWLHY